MALHPIARLVRHVTEREIILPPVVCLGIVNLTMSCNRILATLLSLLCWRKAALLWWVVAINPIDPRVARNVWNT